MLFVTNLLAYAKRVLIGRPMRSDAMGHQLLPKRIALPIFASDALSSVAYAPDEVLLTLALAGTRAGRRGRLLPPDRPRIPLGWR